MLVTAIKDPKTGLEGKFSVYHAAAVALVDGAAGERQFSDEAVRVPAIVALRRRVVPTVDTEHRQGAGARRDPAQERRAADHLRRARRRQRREAA